MALRFSGAAHTQTRDIRYHVGQAPLTLSVLGAFSASRGGLALSEWPYAKARVLLVYLAIDAQHVHPRDAVARLLWPALSEARARANLRHAVNALRVRIDGGCELPKIVLPTKETIGLCVDCVVESDYAALLRTPRLLVDAVPGGSRHREQLLSHAIALYRGEFLLGVEFEAHTQLRRWVLHHRDVARRTALQLLAELIDLRECTGDRDGALAAARRHIDIDPYDEFAYRAAMRIHAAAGRVHDAIEQYHQCVTTLRNEVGRHPCEDTYELYRRLCDGHSTVCSKDGAADSIVVAPAERRCATVVVCKYMPDAGLDEDDVLIGYKALRDRCEEIAQNTGGLPMVSSMGEIVIYYSFHVEGVDQTHRAMSAALQILAASAARSLLRPQLGMHHGTILSYGDGTVQACGLTTRVAAALAEYAEGGTCLMSTEVTRRIAGRFELVSTAARTPAWLAAAQRLVGEKPDPARDSAPVGDGRSAHVGSSAQWSARMARRSRAKSIASQQ